MHEPHAEREQQQRADTDEHDPDACEPEQERNLGRSLASASNLERSAGKDDARDKQQRSQEVKEQRQVFHGREPEASRPAGRIGPVRSVPPQVRQSGS